MACKKDGSLHLEPHTGSVCLDIISILYEYNRIGISFGVDGEFDNAVAVTMNNQASATVILHTLSQYLRRKNGRYILGSPISFCALKLCDLFSI